MAAAADALVFENEEWLVTEGGLEHKGTGYFIGRERLSDRRTDGLWSWPLHMAEKRWCAPAPFAEAFACAAALYDIAIDGDLARSFKAARCEVAGWSAAVPARVARAPAGLRGGERLPISRQEESKGKGPSGRSERAPRATRDRPLLVPLRAGSRGGATPPAVALRFAAGRPIRRAGTRLVRLLQAALSLR